jgi:hypothetical protein
MLNGVSEIQNLKVINQHKNDMCNRWRRTFTLVPLAPLIKISPHIKFKFCNSKAIVIISIMNGNPKKKLSVKLRATCIEQPFLIGY